jgi:hypothetical protein
MSATLLADVAEQVQKVWGPLGKDEFVETATLASVVNRDYDGQINNQNDTVYVSQINQMTAQRKATSATGANTFETQKVGTTRIAIAADQVFSCAIEVEDLVALQSQIGSAESEIRATMMKAMEDAVNTYLYSLVSPSLSSPDHSIASVTDFNESEILRARMLASQANWPEADRYLFLDPSYYSDLLTVAGLTSADYAGDSPKIGGKFTFKRHGFTVVEDNSAGLVTAGAAAASTTADVGLWFHKSFMHLVLGPSVWELSSQHANKQFGYILSCRMYGGAILGINGDEKHGLTYNS